MKILILTVVYSMGWGVGLVVKKHAEGLIANNFKVFVATPDVDKSTITKNALNIYKIGTEFDEVKNLLMSLRPDVTIVHTPPYFGHIANMHDLDTIKIAYDYGEPFPFLWTGYERSVREEIDFKKYREWIPKFHIHVCISEFIKSYSGFQSSYVHYIGANHVNIKGQEQKVNLKELLNSNGFIITSLSRIGEGESRYKGFDVLKIVRQKLLCTYPADNFTFLLMGRLSVGGEAIKKDLESNGFHILCDVDEDFKREALIQSDLFFSPSLWEGFNLPLIEAQYLGTPAMALSICAHPEVCPFHFQTLDEVVLHIGLLSKDKDYRSWWARVCKNYVQRKFKWENNISQLISLIEDAVKLKRKDGLLKLGKIESPSFKSSLKEIKVLERHLKRMRLEGSVSTSPGGYRIAYALGSSPQVTIIVPSKDHLDDLKKCIFSIINKSTYVNYDILIVENGSGIPSTFDFYEELERYYSNIRVLRWDSPFNFSALNNFAVKNCCGEYLIFLNNDTEVISGNWIAEMLMLCQRDDVGAVGAKLLYPNGTIQHGGIILGIRGISGHAHRNFPKSSAGYMNRLLIVQNLSAVTAACMMTKRSIFNEVNGFDENFPVAFNDVDFCLKIREKGYLIVWTPFAELYHHELKTRGYEDTTEKQLRFSKECEYIIRKWKHVLVNDPYYSPNLTLEKEDFSLRI